MSGSDSVDAVFSEHGGAGEVRVDGPGSSFEPLGGFAEWVIVIGYQTHPDVKMKDIVLVVDAKKRSTFPDGTAQCFSFMGKFMADSSWYIFYFAKLMLIFRSKDTANAATEFAASNVGEHSFGLVSDEKVKLSKTFRTRTYHGLCET